MSFDGKLSKLSELYYLEPCLYPSTTDYVEATNTLVQEKRNHSKNSNTVKVSWRTRKDEIDFASETSGTGVFSTDLGYIFGSNVGNELGVMLTREDLTSKISLTTLSAYILSWHTRNWLKTISLAKRKPYSCVTFVSFQSSKLEIL